MKLTIQNNAGTAKATTLKAYRANPGNLNVAASYAFTLAKKLNERMIVVRGNSYMQAVYHICKECDDVMAYNGGMRKETKVVIVEPNGEVFYAVAE